MRRGMADWASIAIAIVVGWNQGAVDCWKGIYLHSTSLPFEPTVEGFINLDL